MSNSSLGTLVRPAKEADAAAIAAVHLASWLATYRGIVADEYLDKLTAQTFESYHRPRLQDHSEQAARSPFLVACDARDPMTIVGFARAGPSRATTPTGDSVPSDVTQRFSAELYAIYIHPDHFGKGTGRALFSATMRELRNLGHMGVCVWVLSANSGARRFYERMGGKLVGEASITLGGVPYHEVAYGFDPSEI